MKINPDVVQAWLDSFAEKQHDDLRFVPIVVTTEVKKDSIIKMTITDPNNMIEPKSVEIPVGASFVLEGCYYKISFSPE